MKKTLWISQRVKLMLKLTVPLLFFLLPIAPAVAGKYDCRNGQICVWKDNKYRGCFDNSIRQPNSNWSGSKAPKWNNCRWPRNINDQVTSYFNNSSRWVIFYKHKNGRGSAHCVAPGASTSNVGGRMNDTYSSHTVFTRTPSRRWCTSWDKT